MATTICQTLLLFIFLSQCKILEVDNPPIARCKDIIITVSLPGNGIANIVAADIDNGSSDPDGDTIVLSVSPNQVSCADVGQNTITLTVTAGSETDTCTSTVTVEDNIAPVCTPRAEPYIVELDVNGEGSFTSTNIDSGLSTDNCDSDIVEVGPSSFTCADIDIFKSVIDVTLTVEDISGNQVTCVQKVIVKDNIAPVCTPRAEPYIVELDVNGEGSFTSTNIDSGLSTDNCDSSIVEVGPSSFTCADIDIFKSVIDVTLTVEDPSGNQDTCVQKVIVKDNIAPVCMTIAAPYTVELDDNGEAEITENNIDGGSSDVCGIGSISVAPNSFTCANVGTNIDVTLKVVDNNNNQASCTQTVIVEDNIGPVCITAPFTLQLDDNGDASIQVNDINDG
eukprot:260217_1